MSTDSTATPSRLDADSSKDLATWVNRFSSADIPVLQTTADTLESLRANEDRTDANSIGEMISNDPLMMLKVFMHTSSVRGQREIAPAETATAALVMMGISPFFRRFGPQQTVDERLASNAGALAGFGKVLQRAYRSANFALAMAVHRADPHAAAIHAAAMLHEFTEMLLWVEEPLLAMRIQEHQSVDGNARSQDMQLAVLGVRLTDIQDNLVAAWHLPKLLRRSDPGPIATSLSAIRTVTLAANLARHTADAWDNSAAPADLDEIAKLLNMSVDDAAELMRTVDTD